MTAQPFSPTATHLRILNSVLAYHRVWVRFSQDPETIKLAGLWRRSAFNHRSVEILVREGFINLDGPRIIGGGCAAVVTKSGLDALLQAGLLDAQTHAVECQRLGALSI
jgi:hypothetical protein